MSEIKQYVCGFIFFKYVEVPGENLVIPEISEPRSDSVLLILKDRPDWQAGKFNGIGGKVEPGEYPLAAMQRECFEECGLRINKWRNYCRMEGEDFQIQFYTAYQDYLPQWESKTSEKVHAFPLSCLPANLINSNRYLIPLAREKDMDFAVIYTK
jgi:8-oxo-dGTP diphosphatase